MAALLSVRPEQFLPRNLGRFIFKPPSEAFFIAIYCKAGRRKWLRKKSVTTKASLIKKRPRRSARRKSNAKDSRATYAPTSRQGGEKSQVGSLCFFDSSWPTQGRQAHSKGKKTKCDDSWTTREVARFQSIRTTDACL